MFAEYVTAVSADLEDALRVRELATTEYGIANDFSMDAYDLHNWNQDIRTMAVELLDDCYLIGCPPLEITAITNTYIIRGDHHDTYGNEHYHEDPLLLTNGIGDIETGDEFMTQQKFLSAELMYGQAKSRFSQAKINYESAYEDYLVSKELYEIAYEQANCLFIDI